MFGCYNLHAREIRVGCALEIYKDFTFEAAHLLPNVPIDHKCRRLHGHSYRVRLYIGGPLGESSGWVMDFAEIKKAFDPILNQIDHYYLNEIEGLENPTCENLAIWIWEKTRPVLPLLSKIEVGETCTSGCVYQGK